MPMRVLRWLWRDRGVAARAARLAILLALALTLFPVFFERMMVFPATRFPNRADDWTVAGEALRRPFGGARLEECEFTASDGVRLHAFYGRGPAAPGRKTLLWCHGNAGNIAGRLDMMEMLLRLPADVLLFDYRGYGKSEGTPTEEGVYRDADAAWDFLVKTKGVPPERIVLFGKSLGGAIAIDLAARVRPAPAGLVVQSSFTSTRDVAASTLPFIPRLLMSTRMDSLSKIARVRCPVLFIHSPADEIIPYRMGRALFDAATGPKTFLDIPNSPHNETWIVGGQRYEDGLKAFLDSLPAGKAP